MELRHMRYFLAVADELHFGRAATRLQMAQPPLSRQIRALEREVGVPLLLRTPRGVRLTDAGRVFREECRDALAQAERARDRARGAARGELGWLTVGFDPALEMALVPRLMGPFAAQHPDVRLAVHSLNADDQGAALQAGTIQVGVVPMPVGVQPDVAIEPLVSERICAVLPERHRLARRSRLALRTLAREPLIVFARRTFARVHDLVADMFREAHVTPQVHCEVTHLQTCLALVAAGIGVTFLPAGSLGVCSRGIVHRPLGAAAPSFPVGVIRRRNDASTLVGRFVSLAHAALGDPRRSTLGCGAPPKLAPLRGGRRSSARLTA
jgi:DNA-binding transcriptional LysR family regulator